MRGSYKKELMRNGLDAAERPPGVRTGKAVTGFSYEEIVGVEWSSRSRNQLPGLWRLDWVRKWSQWKGEMEK